MPFEATHILSVLDGCCDASTFPVLDNGYVFLADTRLSLFRSSSDWAMVIEVFGFSPRSGLPDTHIYTFASRLNNRNAPERYVTRQAYDSYLVNNPHNESRFIFPISEGLWQDAENGDLLAGDATELEIRGKVCQLPAAKQYGNHGIDLERPPRIQVFELCRLLSETAPDLLATSEERRVSVLPEMEELLRIEDWHHPDIADGERPSGSETFRQLAKVLVTGNKADYCPTAPSNNHWRHWPEAGRL